MTETLQQIVEGRRRISTNFVRKMTNDELCELSEELVARCLGAQGQAEVGEVRQRLDVVNREGERRKIFCWR